MKRSGMVAAVLATIFVVPAQAAIHKCQKDGAWVFSDKPCAPVRLASVQADAQQDPAFDEAADEDAVALAAAPPPQVPAQPLTPAAGAVVDAESAPPAAAPVLLPNGLAQLRLGAAYVYLDPEESRHVIEELWGNPPGSADGVLGMILPRGIEPTDEESWGVVITYADDGHVSDEDAGEIDYQELLEAMQAEVEESNEYRAEAGYPTLKLAGWAEPPHYDRATHKMYWAKDLQFGEADGHTLNYAIRVLGREGVLELNAVASTEQLFRVKRAMEDVVGFAEFTDGNRYADYKEGSDRLAAYGLASLIAGGVAAKKGLFAGLLLLALKLKKLLLIGVLVLGGLAAKLFKRG